MSDAPGHVNDFAGTADLAVQARQIFGGIHFHQHGDEQRERAQAGSRSGTAPRELPPDRSSFRGRARELTLMRETPAAASGSGSPRIILIRGLGGTGKTTLGLHWAHEIGADFPDGHLFARLGATASAGPASFADVLWGFLDSLGVPAAKIPAAAEQRASLFRTLTADLRMLIFLDDAMSTAQVEPLIPAAGGCLVIITSWYRLGGLAGHRPQPIDLSAMEPDDAFAVLGAIAGEERLREEPAAAATLAERCGYLPLALITVAARLAGRPGWPVARLSAMLQEAVLDTLSVEGEALVRRIFDVTYAQLAGPVAELYPLLGVHPDEDLTAESIAILTGRPAGIAESLLDELVDAHLIEEAGDGYRMHHLVREHAREVAGRLGRQPDNTLDAAVRRVLEWRLRRAVAADGALSKRFRVGGLYDEVAPMSDPVAAMTYLAGQPRNLITAVAIAHRHGWHDLTWQFCEASWNLYFRGRMFADWIAGHLLGVASAQALGDLDAEHQMHSQLGTAYLESGQHDAAYTSFGLSLEAARRGGNRRAEASALQWQGLALLAMGRASEAFAHLDVAVDLTDEAGSDRGKVLVRMHRARSIDALGRHDEAVGELAPLPQRFLDLPDRPDLDGRGRALQHLSRALRGAGRPAEALEAITEARTAVLQEDVPLQIALVDQEMGEAALGAGDIDTARKAFLRCLPVLRILGHADVGIVSARIAELELPG